MDYCSFSLYFLVSSYKSLILWMPPWILTGVFDPMKSRSSSKLDSMNVTLNIIVDYELTQNGNKTVWSSILRDPNDLTHSFLSLILISGTHDPNSVAVWLHGSQEIAGAAWAAQSHYLRGWDCQGTVRQPGLVNQCTPNHTFLLTFPHHESLPGSNIY